MAQPPASRVKPHLEPWEAVDWSPERLRSMYSNWGSFYARKQHFQHGIYYMNKSLELKPDCSSDLVKRSQFMRLMGKAPKALLDCQRAEDILRSRGIISPHVSLETCDALYESNRLEDFKAKLHDNLRVFNSSTTKGLFLKRLCFINENFNDTLSENLSPEVQRLIKKMIASNASKPEEKQLDCDVVSILEKEEEVLSPLEIARRKRIFKIYNQTYLNRSWIDVMFLRKLRENSNLLLDQSMESTPCLRQLANRDYKTLRTLTKMLQTRCPMYSSHMEKYPRKDLYEKHKRENLFRIQYQTRRNMFKILKSIRQLISSGELNKLNDFVEEVMGDYVTTKTNRIMPWKFEFVCEVYNYLGLARINEYKIPRDMKILNGKQRLLKLFKLPTDKNADTSSRFIFGDRSAIQRPDTGDTQAIGFKRRIARMENRMRFAKYPIERSYLLHEIAQAHLSNNSFDAACSVARKAIDESKQCNSTLWSFLNLMIICKAHAVLGKVEREKEALKDAFQLAQKMKNIDQCVFIDICLKVNAEELELRKTLTSIDVSLIRRQRSQRTVSSLDNQSSLAST
ncbi:uncharacterized protein LOC115620798 [Scaptodrosophila lebanonensis]|uniref:Uncharacterized protein LOC115620798 n=1 Tax=Drosophila lebanonensis TaxID=7225 RepID=A0A6J2SZP5_DROLE|nr:uncharacterized protein LOC115620798 [Scaptodrosophila lebanonensis]